MKIKITIFYILIINFLSVKALAETDTTAYFSVLKIKEDIDSLITGYKRYHPTFSNEQEKKLNSLKNKINEPRSALELFRKVQPIIAKDLHTTIIYRNKIYPEIENPFFPFRVTVFNDSISIKENLSSNNEISKGDFIKSINGVSSEEIIDDLTQLIHGEMINRKIYSLSSKFHVYYRLAYGNFDSLNLVIKKGNKSKNIKVPGANWSSFKNDKEDSFIFKQLEENISYLKIPSFRNTENINFSRYIDSVFSVLSNGNTKNLIMDVRGGGGLSDYIDTLMGYLTDKPYRLFLEERIKVSPESRDYILSKKDLGKYSKDYFTIKYPEKKPVKQKYIFRGDLYLLVDAKSASCHTLFSAIIKCNKLGKLIGEEAGQPLISNGGLTKFALPNTKLICFSAMSTYLMPCAKNEFESVKPDFKVIKTADDLINDKDVILDSAIKIIKNKN
jgi:hypothetical protein